MITGELKFTETMFDENDPTKPYYKITYIVYILFVIGMTMLANNMLIGMENLFYLNTYLFNHICTKQGWLLVKLYR